MAPASVSYTHRDVYKRQGFNRLRSVVVASGIISSFKAPPGFDKLHFWTQTFQVATIARTLAQQTTSVDPETAFTCALIHNIGELLIQSTLPEEAGLINLAIEKGSSRVDACLLYTSRCV